MSLLDSLYDALALRVSERAERAQFFGEKKQILKNHDNIFFYLSMISYHQSAACQHHYFIGFMQL